MIDFDVLMEFVLAALLEDDYPFAQMDARICDSQVRRYVAQLKETA